MIKLEKDVLALDGGFVSISRLKQDYELVGDRFAAMESDRFILDIDVSNAIKTTDLPKNCC